jgi:hypothetical protein
VNGSGVMVWMLEPENPSARYLALTRLLDRPPGDGEVREAQAAIPAWGPARAILDAQWPEGYWMQPGVGYSPKYKATAWQIIFLAAMGTPHTEAIERACGYVLAHSRLPDGRFSAYKTAKGAVACLNGNLLRAMHQLGHEDPSLEESTEALAVMVARDRYCCRFNAARAEKGRPRPASMSDGLPCAWGAVKALGAFATVPEEQRSPAVRAAIEAGVELLLAPGVSPDGTERLASGHYPTASKPSPLWHKFGFPLGYTSDLLEALEVLGQLGLGGDPRLAAAVEVVRSKRAASGRWLLEHTLSNSWANFGQVGQPNKWVTLRARGVLKGWESAKGCDEEVRT